MGYASGNYQTLSPHTGWAEQNPEDWWNRTYEALNTALSIARSNARTGVHGAGIGLTGQMHSLVLLNGTGTPVRPAIVWLDSRARTLVPEIHNTLETNNLLNCVKNRVAPGLTLSPLVWLQRNEPQALACAETLLLPKDYIRFRLTNTLGTDMTDASGTLLYDIPARSWSADILSAFNLPPSILPDIAAPSEPAATVAAELANSLGLDNQPIVATGAADQQASTLATGVLKPGLVQMMLGTGVQIASPTASGELELNGSLNYFCHHEGWLVQGSVQNGGSALN